MFNEISISIITWHYSCRHVLLSHVKRDLLPASLVGLKNEIFKKQNHWTKCKNDMNNIFLNCYFDLMHFLYFLFSFFQPSKSMLKTGPIQEKDTNWKKKKMYVAIHICLFVAFESLSFLLIKNIVFVKIEIGLVCPSV